MPTTKKEVWYDAWFWLKLVVVILLSGGLAASFMAIMRESASQVSSPATAATPTKVTINFVSDDWYTPARCGVYSFGDDAPIKFSQCQQMNDVCVKNEIVLADPLVYLYRIDTHDGDVGAVPATVWERTGTVPMGGTAVSCDEAKRIVCRSAEFKTQVEGGCK